MGKVKCPGSIRNATPTPIERKCHNCGVLVEMWSDEEKAECHKCGTTIFKDKVLPVSSGASQRKSAWETYLMLKRFRQRQKSGLQPMGIQNSLKMLPS